LNKLQRKSAQCGDEKVQVIFFSQGETAMKVRLLQWAGLVVVASLALPVRASVLTFDGIAGAEQPVPQNYGDNVSSLPGPDTNGYIYDGSGYSGPTYGPTPNVVVDYAPLPNLPTANGFDYWPSSGTFGDLVHVLYSPDQGFFTITLTAQNGHLVSLKSFDLAADTANATINNLKVTVDGTPTDITPASPNNVLHKWSDAPANTVLTHTSFDLTADSFTGTTVQLRLDNSSGTIGIDNIAFAEVVPEPASIGLLGCVATLLLRRRRLA
jgi:hypothetical protein